MATDPKTLAHRKEHNLCPRDGRPNFPNRMMCEYCLKKAAEKSERYRQKKIKVGLCTSCGEKESIGSSRLCLACKDKSSVYMHNSHVKRYNSRKKINQCTLCDNDAASGKTACQSCLDKRASLKKNKYTSNASNNKCIQCGNDIDCLKGKRCQTCIEKRNIWYKGSTTQSKEKARRDENREAVLKHYGDQCICCGEKEPCFLAIDHIDGKGNTHRKKIKKWGSGFFKWLIDNNFPDGFQVLCHNCNMGKHLNNGLCPHKDKTSPSNPIRCAACHGDGTFIASHSRFSPPVWKKCSECLGCGVSPAYVVKTKYIFEGKGEPMEFDIDELPRMSSGILR